MKQQEMHPADRRAREQLAGQVEVKLFEQDAIRFLILEGLLEETVVDGKPVYLATDEGRAVIAAEEHLDATRLFGILERTVGEQFGLNREQALVFIEEACKAGGMPYADGESADLESADLLEDWRRIAIERKPQPVREPPPF